MTGAEATQSDGERGIAACLLLDRREDALSLPGGVDVHAMRGDQLDQLGRNATIELPMAPARGEKHEGDWWTALVVGQIEAGARGGQAKGDGRGGGSPCGPVSVDAQ